jgi:hypothetical protein
MSAIIFMSLKMSDPARKTILFPATRNFGTGENRADNSSRTGDAANRIMDPLQLGLSNPSNYKQIDDLLDEIGRITKGDRVVWQHHCDMAGRNGCKYATSASIKANIST